MSQRTLFRIAALSIAACLAALPASLVAQTGTEKNPPRRLPPTGAQATDIPAGVDTGSPATSNQMPLGTPVPPALAPDRGDQNKRSAAARAAARPLPARTTPTTPASGDRVAPGPAALGAQTDARDPGATLPRAQRPVARRAGVGRADCVTSSARADAPVALPQSGFLGSSAALSSASAVARGPSSRPC